MSRYSKNPSFWERETFLNFHDYIIIGAGMTGMLTAIKLKENYPNKKVLILERSFLSSGASTKNAGFACFGSMTELLSDLKDHSEEEVMNLVSMRYKGLQLLQSTLKDYDIEFHLNGGYELFTHQEEELFESCKAQIQKINKNISRTIGIAEVFSIEDELIAKNGLSGVDHLILNQKEGQLNTGLLMKSLLHLCQKKNVKIYNGLNVQKIENNGSKVDVLLDNGWELQGGKVIVANNAFASFLLPDVKVKAVRNPVLVTSKIENLRLKGCFHFQEGYIYLRNIADRVLIGGARHYDFEGETTSEFGINTLLEEKLHAWLKTHVLKDEAFTIAQKWSGILGVGKSKKPIVKQIKDNIFVAAKMGGMGVAISSLVAEQVCELASN